MAAEMPFPKNPRYGSGATRRRVRLINGDGRVEVKLTDIFHEMRCVMLHDGQRVGALLGQTVRIPNSSCADAPLALSELTGLPLDTPAQQLYGGGRAKRHCTHLLDLAVLAIAHASRRERERVYDMLVPDELDQPVIAEARRNGVVVHCWTIREETIIEPEALAGKPVCNGFTRWAAQTFDGDDYEAAMLLSRTCLIARGRAYFAATMYAIFPTALSRSRSRLGKASVASVPNSPRRQA